MAKIKYNEYVEGKWFEDILTNAEAVLLKLEAMKKGLQDVASVSKTSLKGNKLDTAKDLKTYTENVKAGEKAVKELALVEKELQKIYDAKRKAYAELEASRSKENILLKEAQFLLNKEKTLLKEKLEFQQAERGSIKQLEAANKILVRRRRELNLTTEEGTRQYNNLSSAIKKNEDKLKAHDKTIGRHYKNVGNYKDGIGKVSMGLTEMIGVFGLSMGALEAFKGVMSSNEAIADKFRNTTAGLGGAFSFLGNALATMDFSNLIGGMRDAYNEASRYEKAVDELDDRERALQNQIAERERDQARAYTKARQLKKTDPKEAERQLIEYERLEKEKLKLQLAYNKLVLDNEIQNVQKIVQNQSKGVKVSEQTIKDFINNYDKLIDTGAIESGIKEYNKLIRNSQDEVEKYDKATQTYYKDRIFNQEKFIANYKKLSQEQKKSISLGLLEKNLVTKNDDDSRSSREKLSKAINQSIKDEKESAESSGKIARTMQGIRSEIFGEQQSQTKALIKTKEDLLKVEEELDRLDKEFMENSLEIQAKAYESARQIELDLIYDTNKKKIQEIKDNTNELLRTQKEALDAQVISYEEYDKRIRNILKKQADDLQQLESEKKKRENEALKRSEERMLENYEKENQKKIDLQNALVDATIDGLNYIADMQQKVYEKRLNILEKEKEASMQHEDTLRALAETRSESVTDNLAFEAKRQADIRKKEIEEQKKAQRWEMITATINAFGGYAKKGDNKALGNTIRDITALIGFAQSIPGFKDGVIDLQGKGTATSDSIPAMLSKGETVLTAKTTSEYKPEITAMHRGTYRNDNKKIINRLENIEKAISSKPEYSYDIDSMANLITERVKRNNKIIVNHYKQGKLC